MTRGRGRYRQLGGNLLGNPKRHLAGLRERTAGIQVSSSFTRETLFLIRQP
jgi:hypothetical protein